MDTVTCIKALTSLAIVMSAYGVGILFFYGVPFGRRLRGELWHEQAGANRRAEERWLDLASWAGLIMGLMGAGLQAWVLWRG